MQDIWKEKSIQFQRIYQLCLNMPITKLISLLENNTALVYTNYSSNLTSLITCGCQHFHFKNSLAGCSMCNLHRKSIETDAALTGLRDRDRYRYSELVQKSFINARGIVRSRTIHEYLFSYDFLNPLEIPDECLDMLLSAERGVMKRKPWIYEFETTARSITKERLQLLKQYVGNRDTIIRIGVECADEFIRNEWLNKNISNQQIMDSIAYCHEAGIKITGNVLLGIPGFTEELSINQFLETVYWLFSLNIDSISCSLLSRTKNSLQGFIHDSLFESSTLRKYGLTYKEHTGIPWLFSLIRIIHQLYKSEPKILKKMYFGQFIENYIEQPHSCAYNHSRECSCFKEINRILSLGQLPSDWMKIRALSMYESDPCYPYYLDICKRQSEVTNVADNMRILSKEIIQKKWGEDNQRLQSFYSALHKYYQERI